MTPLSAAARSDSEDARTLGGPHDPQPLGRVAGWGRIGVSARQLAPSRLERALEAAPLLRGLGRSYGDASLPPPDRPIVATSVNADRILEFDPATGRLRAEAGLSLREIVRLFLPRGWFVPVTPGTQFVTLGGMVAADVHGKNHHVDGSFGRYVERLRVRTGSGDVLWCSRRREPDLFRLVLGGMGMGAHVLEVEVRLRRVPSPWIVADELPARGIDEFLAALGESSGRWPYTVGWIDCLRRGRALGRGVLFRGRFAEPDEAPPDPPPPIRRVTIPCDAPAWLLSSATMRWFNEFYALVHCRRRPPALRHPERFFYPLDSLLHWNRLYGRRGFIQYQCVLPAAAGREAVRDFLDLLTRRGGASFLCVIKDCGEESDGLLSFPMPGVTVAVDVPLRHGTQALVDALNAFVAEAGGRIYLAKDALTRRESFLEMEPRLDRFLEVRRRYDPAGRIRSGLSVRLFGDRA